PKVRLSQISGQAHNPTQKDITPQIMSPQILLQPIERLFIRLGPGQTKNFSLELGNKQIMQQKGAEKSSRASQKDCLNRLGKDKRAIEFDGLIQYDLIGQINLFRLLSAGRSLLHNKHGGGIAFGA